MSLLTTLNVKSHIFAEMHFVFLKKRPRPNLTLSIANLGICKMFDKTVIKKGKF